MVTYRVNFNHSPKSIFGEARDGGKKIPCGAFIEEVRGQARLSSKENPDK
jgi:hypothetical protein